jgi:hypothetical protein
MLMHVQNGAPRPEPSVARTAPICVHVLFTAAKKRDFRTGKNRLAVCAGLAVPPKDVVRLRIPKSRVENCFRGHVGC